MDELDLYTSELQRLLERVCRSLEGLGASEVNWRPAAPESNSLYVIATHVLGNAQAWVLGIVCGRSVERDREAEFRASGDDPKELIGRARRLSEDFARALSALLPGALEEKRRPAPPLLGIGPADELTVREALMRVLVHGLMHVGQMQITRDLAIAAVRHQAAAPG
jgi:hypothetical protein